MREKELLNKLEEAKLATSIMRCEDWIVNLTVEELETLLTLLRGEWVSVKERLPEFDGKYLCYIEQPQECGAVWHYQAVRECIFNTWRIKDRETITHWKKLGKGPTE